MATGDRGRWNDKWAAAEVGTSHGSKLVELIGPWLPESGRVLDVAGGGSTDSLELARRGLDVTVCDVSDVGLIQARQRAIAEDLQIETVEIDLDSAPLPTGPWDVITVANYLNRELLSTFGAALTDGGIVAVIIATVTNLERHPKPGAAFLLDRDEIRDAMAGLQILHHSEEWRDNVRHEAHLVARAARMPA